MRPAFLYGPCVGEGRRECLAPSTSALRVAAAADIQREQCCTRPCQIFGAGAPTFALMDKSNPHSGGVVMTYVATNFSRDDPFWCDYLPGIGAVFLRNVTFNITCDRHATTPAIEQATLSNRTDCTYCECAHG